VSARRSDAKLVLAGEPRVQLLPQSVRDRERAAATRRRLAMLVVLAIVLVGGGYGFAWMRNDLAQQQLTTARQATESILSEQTQYSEGTRAAARVRGIREAQVYATSNEVLWESIATRIAAMMPGEARLGQVVGISQAPWEPVLPVEGPLRSSRLALLTVSFTSQTIIEPSQIVPQLATMPGYVDSRLDSSVWDDARGRYVTIVRVMFDEQAMSGRFVSAEPAAEPAADPSGDDE